MTTATGPWRALAPTTTMRALAMTDPLPQAGAAGTRGAVYPVGADTLVVDNPHFSFPLHVAAH